MNDDSSMRIAMAVMGFHPDISEWATVAGMPVLSTIDGSRRWFHSRRARRRWYRQWERGQRAWFTSWVPRTLPPDWASSIGKRSAMIAFAVNRLAQG